MRRKMKSTIPSTSINSRKERKMKRTLPLMLLVLFSLLASGCATASTSGNYTLRSGNTLRGDLYITSGNASLEEGSHVTGSVIMTSGDLKANGEIGGTIHMSSGEIILGPTSIVHGDIRGTSGDVSQEEGSQVEGQILMDLSNFAFGSPIILGLLIRYCLLPLLVIGLLIFLLVLFLRRRRAASALPDQGKMSVPSSEDPKQRLSQLKEMLDEDLITKTEYESKKAEILADI
jgi:hypothetical protein